MARGVEFANVGGTLIPAVAQSEINSLHDDKAQLTERNKKLYDEVKYLKRVLKDQGKALDINESPDKLVNQIKGQSDELRHIKKKKNEL